MHDDEVKSEYGALEARSSFTCSYLKPNGRLSRQPPTKTENQLSFPFCCCFPLLSASKSICV
jgi:hypothetical protein